MYYINVVTFTDWLWPAQYNCRSQSISSKFPAFKWHDQVYITCLLVWKTRKSENTSEKEETCTDSVGRKDWMMDGKQIMFASWLCLGARKMYNYQINTFSILPSFLSARLKETSQMVYLFIHRVKVELYKL